MPTPVDEAFAKWLASTQAGMDVDPATAKVFFLAGYAAGTAEVERELSLPLGGRP